MFIKQVLIACMLLPSLGVAQSVLKAMSYNLLEFPEANPQNRELILRDILNEYEPDLFMVCELQSPAGASLILDASLNDTNNTYTSATFVYNQSAGGTNLQQLLFFRRDKFVLLAEETLQTNIRDINHYTLQLNTANGQNNPVVLEIFVAHLKSSQGGSNQAERLAMVQQFTNRLESLDPNAFVLFAGDLNLYTSTELAYIELLDPTNAIVMADPIDTPGAWNSNINFQDVHTQSTRISSGPFGAGSGGGLDDRFDFILVSENMLSDPNLHYLPNTYQSYGNNGNCFNLSINDASCDGPFSQSLRDLLYNMSDHLPIVMQLETNEAVVLQNPHFVSQNTLFLKNTLVYNQLELNFPDTETHPMVLYNSLGQRLMEFTVPGGENKVIDVSFIAPGLYYLKDTSGNSAPVTFLKA
ncbi:MAG: endonuclease/exonuclease/phosphatase family protein [Flavobacteriaceae bacterium]